MTLQEAVARNMRNHWDYAPEPEAVTRCPECGHAIYQGDEVYYGHGTDHIIGCERCTDKRIA